jgi:hypothetical protein
MRGRSEDAAAEILEASRKPAEGETDRCAGGFAVTNDVESNDFTRFKRSPERCCLPLRLPQSRKPGRQGSLAHTSARHHQ